MFEDLLERLASALDRAGIRYMIIGGQAVLVHGEPRLTRDVDVTLAVDTNRLSDVVAAMTGVGLKPLVDPESFTRKTMVLPCADTGSGVRVDLIFSYSPYERQAVERAQSIRIGGSDVRFASVEDLVIHKVLAGRPRDIEDVVGVMRRNPAADLVYIRSVVDEFSAATGEPLIDRLEEALKRCR
jgi:predicted nucleotidyltransferase